MITTTHRALRTQLLMLAMTLTGVEAQAGLTVAYPQSLWPTAIVDGVPVHVVYYQIDPLSDPNATPNIMAAIGISNADFPGVLYWKQWDPNTDGPNYVDINLSADNTNGQCEADEGYEAQPAQPMQGATNCTIGTILHEMGHVIGLWHEQSRSDRNSYVTVNYANVIKGSWSNFQILSDNVQILEPYDYASVMQYIPFAFTRNGGPVIETIPAGMPLSGYEGVPAQSEGATVPAQPVFDYSAGDKEAIERLYGAAPTEVTVTSNPVGLQVIVDGKPYKTPHSYKWALWSSHTLGVPAGAQKLPGYVLNSSNPAQAESFYYTYGRWNDSTAQNHTIVVAPGDGSPPFPATSPRLATYSANFIQLVPYELTIFPSGSGTVTVSPQPQAYSGITGEPLGQFLVGRQEATLTATPETGWHFYWFNNAPFWLPGGLGANPKSFYVPDTGNPINTITQFYDAPVYTVNVGTGNVLLGNFSSNLYAYVDSTTRDSGFVYAPKIYSEDYNTEWVPRSVHTLRVDSPEYPYSLNTRYNFSYWSDGGGQSHSISLPGTSTDYTATMTPEFAPATNFSAPPCGGTATLTPVSPTHDGFYPIGQKLTFTAEADSGWVFAGWSYDLTGLASPAHLTPNGETLVYANFNTVAAPLALTSLSPGAVKAGDHDFTLTLKGTGFSPSPNPSVVSVNGIPRAVTYVSQEELTVPVTAADVAEPGAFQVSVENFPAGSKGCAVFGNRTFLVEGIGALTATPVITPMKGTYGTPQTVSMSDASPESTIYYTLDGTTPTTSSSIYSSEFTVSTTTTVKARALAAGYRLSSAATVIITIN